MQAKASPSLDRGLVWNNAAAVDIIGADGATFVLDFKKGDSPDAANAPGWLINHDSNLGQSGTRIQSDGVGLRAVIAGGFHAGGSFTADYQRVVQTIRSLGGGNFESEVYFSGAGSTATAPTGTSGTFAEMNSVTVARVGATPSGLQFRLSNAHVDNVMFFDVGMSDGEVAGIPVTVPPVPEPTTAVLFGGLALVLAGCRRRRAAA